MIQLKIFSRHSFYQNENENEILLYPARQFKVISFLDAGNQLHCDNPTECRIRYVSRSSLTYKTRLYIRNQDRDREKI